MEKKDQAGQEPVIETQPSESEEAKAIMEEEVIDMDEVSIHIELVHGIYVLYIVYLYGYSMI